MTKQTKPPTSLYTKVWVSALIFLSTILVGSLAIFAATSLDDLKAGANGNTLTAENWDILIEYVKQYNVIIGEGLDKMNNDIAKLETKIDALANVNNADISTELASIKSIVNSNKVELASVKSTIGTINTNVSTVKTDISTVKTNVSGVKSTIDTINTSINSIRNISISDEYCSQYSITQAKLCLIRTTRSNNSLPNVLQRMMNYIDGKQ